uniref:BED-type domain-containing protein n=1 Tax=Oryzias melastigma TaxID=30732 RepID=A0A3B3CRQ3_ORYME
LFNKSVMTVLKMIHKPRGKSTVWMYFGLKADETGKPMNTDRAVCRLCRKVVVSKGNTTNLRSHLRRRHPAEFIEITNLATSRAFAEAQGNFCTKSSSIVSFPQRPLPVLCPSGLVSPSSPTVSPQVINAIINFLITDLQPPSVVEGSGFRQLLFTLLPSHRELPKPWLLESVMRDQHIRGRVSLAQLLKQRSGGAERDEMSDHTAPLECEPWKCPRPSTNQGEAFPFVTLSVEVWLHSWQGNSERYLTLWAHCIDESFSFHNQVLATQKLVWNGENDLEALEAQVKAMTAEWGGFRSNFIVLGVEGKSRIGIDPATSEKAAEATGNCAHPNSTTFLEREDSASPEEVHASEAGQVSGGFPFVPCFFSSVQGCIEELMAHPVIHKTLRQFQDYLSELFLPPPQSKGSLHFHAHKFLKSLPKEEQTRLTSWAHRQPAWKNLYPLLSTLVKHKSEFSPKESGSDCSNTSAALQSLRSEWKVLEDLCLVLKPLDVACQTLAKETFPRLSLIKPILTGLLSRHLVARPGDSSSILKEVKRMMRRRLTSCYSSPAVNRVLSVACSLDPQFRDKRLKECPPINFREIVGEESDPGEPEESEDPDPCFQPGLSGMEFLLGDLFCSGAKSRNSSVEESVEMEISVFRADKGSSLGMEPLQWWRTKAVQFPLLASVARVYLAAPAVAGNAAQDFVSARPRPVCVGCHFRVKVILSAARSIPAVDEDVGGMDENQQSEKSESDVHLEQTGSEQHCLLG